ncbi:hypothetical protein KY329_00405 [Candidatus Woesearchaeota archaeon]|nr:hypothetical protein [Candidatus Woesearchaeota archaeon]
MDEVDRARRRFNVVLQADKLDVGEFQRVIKKFESSRKALYVLLTMFKHITRKSYETALFDKKLKEFYKACEACYLNIFNLLGFPQGEVRAIEDIYDASQKYPHKFAEVIDALHLAEYYLRIIYDEKYKGARIGEVGELIEVPLRVLLTRRQAA